ncbi:hypothetical protein JT05_14235 [Desulfosporosinus sp. Tol-M]|nr:hypothetical protein JT05_14235 [Desulfosporosinus sp. Tol-M]
MSKIGRNDPCPCGSGAKYKNCCLNNNISSNRLEKWKTNALQILTDSTNNESINLIFFKTLEFIERRNWVGASRAVSAVLYVLFSEAGLSPSLWVGEVESERGFFDHSWIELNGSIFDAAIYKNLGNGMAFSPVINGYDIDTLEIPKWNYGIRSGIGMDSSVEIIVNTPFNNYMSGFQEHKNGLWGIVDDIGKECALNIDVKRLTEKYSNTRWSVR